MSIVIQGTVTGNISRVTFEPSRPRFTDAGGNTVLAEPIYARVNHSPGISGVYVELPDNTEMISHKRWVWICYEYRGMNMVKTMFTLSSEPGTHRYADLRPVGGFQ